MHRHPVLASHRHRDGRALAGAVAALALALTAAGCVEVSDPCGEVSGEPSAQLGSGNLGYEEVVSGGTLGAHYGPQGGYHVYGSVRAQSLYPGSELEIDRVFHDSAEGSAGLNRLNPVASYTVVDMNGDLRASRELQEPLLPEGETLERHGDLVFFVNGSTPETIEGTVVDFTMTMTDICGREVTDEVTNLTLTVQTPPP